MKKRLFILSLFVLALALSQTKAQGLFIKVQPGYGLALSSSNFGVNVTYTNTQTITTETESFKYENVKGSYGNGLNVGASIGYMFNEYMGAELGIGYHIGGSYEVFSKGNSTSTMPPLPTVTSDTNRTTTYKANQFRLNPAIIITSGSEGLAPYLKFGLVLGIGTKVSVSQEYTSKTSVTAESKSISEWEQSGGMSIGLNGALGATYSISDNISLFAELEIISMSYAPTKQSLVKYTIDGVDKLSTLKTYSIETEYVSDYSATSQFPTPSEFDKPKQELKQYVPFSSFGINVGLQIKFGDSGSHRRRH